MIGGLYAIGHKSPPHDLVETHPQKLVLSTKTEDFYLKVFRSFLYE